MLDTIFSGHIMVKRGNLLRSVYIAGLKREVLNDVNEYTNGVIILGFLRENLPRKGRIGSHRFYGFVATRIIYKRDCIHEIKLKL